MPNSSAIRISGRPLDCNNAMASRLNSSVKLRRGFVIKHPSCPFPERNKGVHQFGGGSAIGKNMATGLMLRHDHGPNYMSDDFQSEIAFLGIEASPYFVRHFATIEELRLALLDFAAWYNTHWLVARHDHRTPAQIRANQQPAMDQAA